MAIKIRFLNQKFTLSEIWKLRLSFLKLLKPAKLINLAAICFSKIFKMKRVLGAPLILMVESSSRCDMACAMCPVILNKTNRPKGDMNLETFKKIIDEIGDGLFAIALWNYGEPLLNPEIFSMISYARRKSIITAISTNALSLNQEKIGRIFDSGLDFLIISFDGATKETYEKFRGEGNFDKVLSNLTLLMEMKKRQSRNKPFVDLQFIVMKENEHQIDDMRALAEKICVDKLSLKKFTYVGGEETWRFLPDKKKYLFGKYKGYKYKGSCLRVIDSSVVLWDGTIVPCCGDLSFKYKFGNVNSDGGFMNIWNNNKYVAFRKTVLKDVQALEICRSCPSKDYNADMFI